MKQISLKQKYVKTSSVSGDSILDTVKLLIKNGANFSEREVKQATKLRHTDIVNYFKKIRKDITKEILRIKSDYHRQTGKYLPRNIVALLAKFLSAGIYNVRGLKGLLDPYHDIGFRKTLTPVTKKRKIRNRRRTDNKNDDGYDADEEFTGGYILNLL